MHHETELQKHIRALANGKTQSYEFIDDQLRCVSESLHPTDADNFFKALLRPLQRPNLSQTAMFVRVNIGNPCADPSEITTITITMTVTLFDDRSLANTLSVKLPCHQLRGKKRCKNQFQKQFWNSSQARFGRGRSSA
jgi:hypothetical protein